MLLQEVSRCVIPAYFSKSISIVRIVESQSFPYTTKFNVHKDVVSVRHGHWYHGNKNSCNKKISSHCVPVWFLEYVSQRRPLSNEGNYLLFQTSKQSIPTDFCGFSNTFWTHNRPSTKTYFSILLAVAIPIHKEICRCWKFYPLTRKRILYLITLLITCTIIKTHSSS